jgi:hypothetical protein
VKTFGAGIFCTKCSAQPWPDDPAIRESFDLLDTSEGWRCELHRAGLSIPRAKPVTASQALEGLERALKERDEGDINRTLAVLRKAVAAKTKRDEKTAKSKRSKLTFVSPEPEESDT